MTARDRSRACGKPTRLAAPPSDRSAPRGAPATYDAASAIIETSTTMIANVIGSAGLTRVEQTRERTRARGRGDGTDDHSSGGESESAADHQPRDALWLGAEGDADSNLSRALTDGVCDDTVQADRREHERKDRERGEQRHGKACRREAVAKIRFAGELLFKDQLPVDRRCRPMNRLHRRWRPASKCERRNERRSYCGGVRP